MATLAQLFVEFGLDAGDWNRGLRAIQSDAKELEKVFRPTTKALNDVGKTLAATGAGLSAAITAPLVGIGVMSVQAARDFESSFAGVRKTVDGVVDSTGNLTVVGKQISDGFREMAKQIPISVNDLNKVGEAAGQLGIKKEDILKFTRVMADLGNTTNLTADQAATATARIQNIFGAAGKDTDRFGAALVALGNAGASTEQDIINMSMRIAGSGNVIGLTQANVLAFANALSSVGINAETGGSSISRVFLKMSDGVRAGGATLEGFAKVAGMSGADFKRAFQTDAATATTAFIEGLQRIKVAGGDVNGTIVDLFGKSIIMKDTLLRAAGAGDLLRESLELGNKAWQENTALTKEAAERYKTFDSQVQIFWSTINDISITVGEVLNRVLLELLKILNPLIAVVAQVAGWFAQLPQPLQTIAIVIAAVAAAVGPLLLVLGLALTSLAGFVPVIASAVAAIGSISAPVAAIVIGLGAWIAAIAATAGALTALILSNEETRTALTEAWEQIKAAAMQVWSEIVAVFGSAMEKFGQLWAEHGETLVAAFQFGMKVIAGMIGNLASVVSVALKAVAGAIQVFHGIMTADFTKMRQGVEKIWTALWDAIVNVVKRVGNTIINAVKAVTDGVTAKFKAMYDIVVGNSIVPDMMRRIGDEFGSLDGLMVRPAQSAASKVASVFQTMFDRIEQGFRDWKGALKDFGLDVLGGIAGGQSIGDALKGAIGLGNGSSGGGGILGGLLGGGGASRTGTPSGGLLSELGGIGGIASAANLAIEQFSKIGAGHRAANEIVKSQNAFTDSIGSLLADSTLSAFSKSNVFESLWQDFQSNMARFAATDPNNQKVVNQAFATLAPFVTGIRSDFARQMPSVSPAVTGGNVSISAPLTLEVNLNGARITPMEVREVVAPELTTLLETAGRGIRERWAQLLDLDSPGTASPVGI